MNSLDIDLVRKRTNAALSPKNKSALGQYMTPSIIAEYMTSLFDETSGNIKLLDCGAGIGSLTIAFMQKFTAIESIDMWEIDHVMYEQLKKNMQSICNFYCIYKQDFILDAVQNLYLGTGKRYTHAIVNPPYKKINSSSEHRQELRKVGIETVNLYSAFLALTILLMETGGQIVTIIPRSFCNGPYYKPFRELLLKNCSIEHIHIFESRDKAFQDDNVLQENIIIKLIKGAVQSNVMISQSNDHTFTCYQNKIVPFEDVVAPNDPECFIRIATNNQLLDLNVNVFSASLDELGLSVSTGPIVSYRVKDFLEKNPQEGAAPLFYPHHFVDKQLKYPKDHKKPNAIKITDETRKWLLPNQGFYVIIRRFSTKEEKRRIVANVIVPNMVDAAWLGFDNCWNVFHVKKQGFDYETAMGLACFLNSSVLDRYFRIFSGHTQVNATDIRNMKYPSLGNLKYLGKKYNIKMTQEQIDELIGEIS